MMAIVTGHAESHQIVRVVVQSVSIHVMNVQAIGRPARMAFLLLVLPSPSHHRLLVRRIRIDLSESLAFRVAELAFPEAAHVF